MSARLPNDAFALYVSMGLDRSYQRVAAAFGVSKRSVVKAALRENWTGRLKQIEARSQAKLDERLADEIAEVSERHRKMLRAMAGRAARAIQEFPLTSGMEGIRAAEVVIRLERILAGESSERESAVIEKTTRQEIDRLLATSDADLGDEAASGGDPAGDREDGREADEDW